MGHDSHDLLAFSLKLHSPDWKPSSLWRTLVWCWSPPLVGRGCPNPGCQVFQKLQLYLNTHIIYISYAYYMHVYIYIYIYIHILHIRAYYVRVTMYIYIYNIHMYTYFFYMYFRPRGLRLNTDTCSAVFWFKLDDLPVLPYVHWPTLSSLPYVPKDRGCLRVAAGHLYKTLLKLQGGGSLESPLHLHSWEDHPRAAHPCRRLRRRRSPAPSTRPPWWTWARRQDRQKRRRKKKDRWQKRSL